MKEHALLSASGAHRWTRCPASVNLEQQSEDAKSWYAEEGSAAHELMEATLDSKSRYTLAFQGRIFNGFEATEEMCAYVQTYVDSIIEYAQQGGSVLLVEKLVNFAHALGVDKSLAFGTADTIIITPDGELQVHDLKYGRGVQVDAEQNEQMMLYALGALPLAELLCDVKSVRLVIHQPRLNHLSEWACSVEELNEFARHAAELAREALSGNPRAIPGSKQCMFCKAKANCDALAGFVAETTETNLASKDEHKLAAYMNAVEQVEAWCKAVREAVYQRLMNGNSVEGYKLVEGRKGARTWTSEQEAERVMKGMRLPTKQIYKSELISPTQAEKVLRDNPRCWEKLQPLIKQPAGKPAIAPAADKRAAVQVLEEFKALDAD